MSHRGGREGGTDRRHGEGRGWDIPLESGLSSRVGETGARDWRALSGEREEGGREVAEQGPCSSLAPLECRSVSCALW